MYFVDEGAITRWRSGETVLAECPLANGGNLTLLASVRPSTAEFTATVESLLKNNVVGMSDPSSLINGSLLWVLESRDELAVPIIVDLPVPIQARK